MNVIYYELPEYGDDVLMHHGRKGMKWYQHIFSAAKTAGGAVASGAKSVYKTGQKVRNDRIEKAKTNAINTGNYEKIKKYEKYMSDAELKNAQARMQSNIQLRNLQSQAAPSKRVQKKIDKAVRKGDFKSLMKLEKKMSDANFKAAYERLDTRRKLKDMNDQSMVEKGIRVMETIGRVGGAALKIGQNVQGFRQLKADKAKTNEQKLDNERKIAEINDPNFKSFMDKARGLATADAERIMKDESIGNMATRIKFSSNSYAKTVADAEREYKKNKKVYEKLKRRSV
jgi:hypothetical protein